MAGRTRTILIEPNCLRRGLDDAIGRFCSDVLVARGLIAPEVLEAPEVIDERERVVHAVARRWQTREVDFEPDDPANAQSVLESGAMAPAAIDAINRFCRDGLIQAGYLAESDWESRDLDSHKYAIARRVSRGWVAEAQLAD